MSRGYPKGNATFPEPMVSGASRFLTLRTLRKANVRGREVMSMGRKLNGCRRGPMCACGALAADQVGACEKCRFRARWMRRKMRRDPDTG